MPRPRLTAAPRQTVAVQVDAAAPDAWPLPHDTRAAIEARAAAMAAEANAPDSYRQRVVADISRRIWTAENGPALQGFARHLAAQVACAAPGVAVDVADIREALDAVHPKQWRTAVLTVTIGPREHVLHLRDCLAFGSDGQITLPDDNAPVPTARTNGPHRIVKANRAARLDINGREKVVYVRTTTLFPVT